MSQPASPKVIFTPASKNLHTMKSARVAGAIDKTARQVEQSFRRRPPPASTSLKPCSTACRTPSSLLALTAWYSGPTNP